MDPASQKQIASFNPFDRRMMRRVLTLAARGRGLVSPNPMVGAVLVRDGKVVAEGWHHRHGAAHAEIDALAKVGFDASGCSLYVNLEPCCHHGMTPPCTNSVVSSGVRQVFIGTTDPNPLVSGRGVESLLSAGIEVSVGLMEAACRELNRGFFKWITSGRPFVTLKLASTIDGRIADRDGSSRWISCPRSRLDVHALRASVDCVMVGGGTVRMDDPLLLPVDVKARRNPVRVVVSESCRIPVDSRLVQSVSSGPVIVVTSRGASDDRIASLARAGVDVIRVDRHDSGLDMGQAMTELGARRITSVLAEGGSGLAASLLRGSLVDRLLVYGAPMLMGDPDAVGLCGDIGARTIESAMRFRIVSAVRLGDDFRVEYEPLR